MLRPVILTLMNPIPSVETLESVPEPVVIKPKVVSQPKVWSDAPIIEEYESDSDDEYVIKSSKEQETPSFAFVNTVKHVKTPRETVKEQNTCNQSPKVDKRDWNGLMSKKLGLGYGFTRKACFVCGSFGHLIRDCDFHEKRMAKQVELNKKKSKGTGQGENRPVWNNVQRLNHQNKFVPTAVLIRTGRFPVNTARHNFNSQAVSTSAARKANVVRPIVNDVRPRPIFNKTHSPIRRPFNRTTAPKTDFSNQKVNTAGDKAVSVVGGIRETAVKTSAGCNWRSKRHYWNKFSKYNGGSNSRKCDDPQQTLKGKGIVDSGCSRHMTGNKAYLVDYQEFKGGSIVFGGSKGKITGKGKIRTGKLDIDDVYFVKELQDFNIFLCHRCVTRRTSFNLENIVPTGGLACLIAKATVDESNKSHRRLGHVNFKNLNKLVKENLVRGLPSKIFQNDHTCVACQKGKQHKASCLIGDIIEFCGKKLKKKCQPIISHHRAWLRSVSRLSMMKKLGKKESVSKQGRKNAKSGPKLDDSAFDDLDAYLVHGMDDMETEEAVNEGRQSNETEELNLDADTKVIAEDKGSGEKGGSTVSTARPEVSTARPDVGTARQEIGTADPTPPPLTTTIFDDKEMTLADTLVKRKDNKAKGVVFKDIEELVRPARSVLTLKPLPSIDLKEKGKGVLEEPERTKKMTRNDFDAAQVAKDAEVARQLEVELQAEVERERQREEQASMDYIANLYNEFQARIDADHELAV
ncbi:putative ribonuclease H-like domain-containing protein [Tanacetum coccineum]|uniref:Ribonuclease H-like domain-containing protein n=1 Tax=Tanacetum coccineum TaxID=301880 RepID=A0ABQ4YRP0_9ASTR